MDDQSRPQYDRDAARREYLKYIRRVLGKLTPDQEDFYDSVARREPEKVADYLAAVKDGRSPDPAYTERYQTMRLDYGKRRVMKKSLEEPDPAWENSIRCREEGEGPAR